MMRALARQAVQRFAGMEPGRPVGGTYYLYRTLRNLDLDGVHGQADGAGHGEQSAVSSPPLEERLEQDEFDSRHRAAQEARSRPRSAAALVADRGVEAMAKTLRKPLPEDVEFMHACREEMAVAAQGALPADPQARRPPRPQAPPRPQGPARLPQHRAPLAVSYGGVPAEPKFKYPRPAKPELIVIADISGSRGRLRPLHAACSCTPSRTSSRRCARSCSSTASTRSPTTSAGIEDIQEAIHRVNTEADVVWVDGHSDYGHAFEVFWERYGKEHRAEDDRAAARRRAEQLPRQPGVGGEGDRRQGPPRVLAEPRAEVATGTPATRSSASTAPTPTACSSAATCASSRPSSRTSSRREG